MSATHYTTEFAIEYANSGGYKPDNQTLCAHLGAAFVRLQGASGPSSVAFHRGEISMLLSIMEIFARKDFALESVLVGARQAFTLS